MLQLVSSLYWPLFCTLHIYITSLHPRMQSIPGYRKAFSSNSQYALGRLLRSHSQHKNQLEAKALGVPVCTGVGLSYIHLHNQNAPRGKTKQSVWFKWTKHCTCENSIKAALKNNPFKSFLCSWSLCTAPMKTDAGRNEDYNAPILNAYHCFAYLLNIRLWLLGWSR